MKTVFFVVFIFEISLVSSVSVDPCPFREFINFKFIYNKTYANASEEYYRFQIFIVNFNAIAQHNLLSDSGAITHKLAINNYADVSKEEFMERYMGIPRDVSNIPDESEDCHPRFKRAGVTATTAPSDWVPGTINLSTSTIPVKTQGVCGSCWAYSATGVYEYFLLNQLGSYFDLSEQMSVDCARKNGCDGGFMHQSFNYFLANGANFDPVYPYASAANTCAYKNTTIPANGLNSTYARQWYTIPGDELLMTYIISIHGWISACINADDIQFYASGIVQASSCSPLPSHAVIVVGYGNDNATGLDYWLVKNSWGASWGEQGYMKLERGTNACDIANPYSYYRVHIK